MPISQPLVILVLGAACLGGVFLVAGSTVGRLGDKLFKQPRTQSGEYTKSRENRYKGWGGLMIVAALGLLLIMVGNAI